MVTYKIDGQDIKTAYGVHVSKSKGIIGRPQSKERESVSYADEHGEHVMNGPVRYKAREIELDCWIKGSSNNDIAILFNDFICMLSQSGTRRLEVTADGISRSLYFEVVYDGGSSVTPEWHGANSIGVFTVKLKEHKPVKAVYRIEPGSVAGSGAVVIGFSSQRSYDVHWGDGSHTIGAVGSASHTYGEVEYAYVVISGDVEDEGFSLNCDKELIWEVC